MGIPKTKPVYSFAEYLEIEKTSEFKYEFRRGEIFDMAGASANHVRISRNFCFEMYKKMSQKGTCEPFSSDMRVNIPNQEAYYYPDVVLSCEEINNKKSLDKPVLIAEVLSESTGIRDMNQKMWDYFQIPSLQYYLIIAQDRCLVHVYERADLEWTVKLFSDMKDEIFLNKLEVSVFVKDIYAQVYWEA